tara:strand:+ start:27403 stop:28527 length:1125 start_codon:yes stop_codon:yes gene_type:complete
MKKNIFYLFAIITLGFSCSDNDQGSTSDGYNRGALLSNVVNNIIIPAHQNFDNELGVFESSLNSFKQDISIENLVQLQSQFVETYKAWQYIEMFNIGYAEEIFYASKMNIYPANVSRISNNINSENVDLDNNSNQFSAQGFPAIDYLLFGLAENNEQTLYLFSLNQGNNPTFDYLNLLVDKMVVNTDAVVEYWQTEKEDFINSTSNSSTSSLNMLANDFVYFYEKGFRANKIGIPAGVWSGTLPQNVEAYYKSDISKLLALEALQACHDFFNGVHFGASQIDGEGLYEYLAYLDDTNYSDSSMFIGLQDNILDSFQNSRDKLNLLNNDFALQVQQDNMKMLEAYDAIQQGVVRLKTNMLSILGISVDYYDADGD